MNRWTAGYEGNASWPSDWGRWTGEQQAMRVMLPDLLTDAGEQQAMRVMLPDLLTEVDEQVNTDLTAGYEGNASWPSDWRRWTSGYEGNASWPSDWGRWTGEHWPDSRLWGECFLTFWLTQMNRWTLTWQQAMRGMLPDLLTDADEQVNTDRTAGYEGNASWPSDWRRWTGEHWPDSRLWGECFLTFWLTQMNRWTLTWQQAMRGMLPDLLTDADEQVNTDLTAGYDGNASWPSDWRRWTGEHWPDSRLWGECFLTFWLTQMNRWTLTGQQAMRGMLPDLLTDADEQVNTDLTAGYEGNASWPSDWRRWTGEHWPDSRLWRECFLTFWLTQMNRWTLTWQQAMRVMLSDLLTDADEQVNSRLWG